MKKRDYKYIFILSCCFIISIMIYISPASFLQPLQWTLSFPLLIPGISIFVIFVTILHKIKFNEYRVSEFKNFKNIKDFLKDLLETILDPSVFVCSLSILRGLILDYFFN